MITLNPIIVKNLRYQSESDFDKELYEYFLEFEDVYKDHSKLNHENYIKKFTFMYNLCNNISRLKHSDAIFDVYIFYKFIYSRMENFLKTYIESLSSEITNFQELIYIYESTFEISQRINGVLEYFNKEIKSCSNIAENNKSYKDLSSDIWNNKINLLLNVQEIIVNYIFKVYINEDSNHPDENLIKFLRLITKYETSYIEKRYWFITKKITNMLKSYFITNISQEIEGTSLVDRLNILQKYYSKNLEFCEWYFIQFDEIRDETGCFIVDNFIIENENIIIGEIKNLLVLGDWKSFKLAFNILHKIDISEKLNEDIKGWKIENLIRECCEQSLRKEKNKFKENKYSNICRYLNFYKKLHLFLSPINDLYALQLETIVKTDINKCYYKNTTEDSTTLDKTKFASDFADFIYKFLNNYDKSKSKFDLLDNNNLNIIKIFIGLIQNNDEFQLLLQKYIAKRFFAGNNIDRDIYFAKEIANVDTLDVLSSRIHVMIKDTENFHNLNTNFKTVCDYYHIDTNYKVITDFVWGIKETKFMDEQAGYKINLLPREIKDLTKDFGDFYQMMHENRRLKWNYSFSEFEIDFRIGEKIYTIKTTFPMAQILLYFNENEKMKKVDVIREKISLKNIDILKQFQIITEVNDYYIINEEFAADPNELIILTGVNNTIKRLESKKKVKTDTLEIDDMLQAYLVKTMKALGKETSIKRDILIKDCIDRVKYRIDVDRTKVNKQIKKLIEGEYLKINDDGEVVYVP